MKKGFLLFSALFLLAATGVFAKVTAKQEGGVVKVTWTYTAPDASFVGLVGDFQGWNLGGATPMVKDANGVWSVTLDLTPTSEVKYKFNVDDEWTEDPEAPGTLDDGFGGMNGYVVVADLLAGGAAGGDAAAAAGPVAKRIVFGTYTTIRSVTDFVEEDTQSQIKANSYLKFQGDILPNTPLFMEVQFMQGSVQVFDGNADEPFKGENLADLFFNPFYPFNDGGSQPKFGHLRLGVQTDYADILAYNWYAKTTLSQNYFFDLYREMDAWNGAVEVKKTLDLDGIKFGYLLGLSKRPNWSGGENGSLQAINHGTILHGFQSLFDVNVAGYDLQFSYNAREVAKEPLRYFLGNLNHQVALGVKGPIVEKVNFSFQTIANFLNADGAKLLGSADWAIRYNDASIADEVAVGLKVDANLGMFGADFYGSYAGDLFQLGYFFGRNGDDDAQAVNAGYIRATLNPWVAPMEGLKVGLDFTAKLDNAGETMADGGKATATDYKIYADYSSLGLGVYAKADLTAVSDDAMPFKLNEVGATLDVNKLATLPVGLKLYTAYMMDQSWNSTDEAIQLDKSEVDFIATADLSGVGLAGVNAALGFVYRLDGETDVADEDQLGFNLGLSYRATELKNADIFLQISSGAKLFEGDEHSGIDISGGRYGNRDILADPQLVLGVKWDF